MNIERYAGAMYKKWVRIMLIRKTEYAISANCKLSTLAFRRLHELKTKRKAADLIDLKIANLSLL